MATPAMLNRREILACLSVQPLARAAAPIPTGAKPVSHGRINAGEGPVWHPRGVLYFSGRNRITQRDAAGNVSVYRENAGSNGLLIDRQGRLTVCEARSRRVTRTDSGSATTVLADTFRGRRFNSPNDLTIDSQGRIYFSDPRYGARSSMEMRDSSGHLVEGVYRIDAPGQVARIISHEVDRPNGLLVSPKDEYLYVADNNNDTVGGARKLWRFPLLDDGSIDSAGRELIFDWLEGRGPDGLEMDQAGRLFVAAGRNRPNPPFESADRYQGGVYILSPAGDLIDFVAIPVDEVTNCAFGGTDWKTLFITAGGELWSIPTTSPGWVPYPRDRPI